MKANRRTFMIKSATLVSGLAIGKLANAADAPKLSETDPQAQALGYKDNAKAVDKKKFPKYAEGQLCSNCQLYQGKATDPMAPCAIFGGKQVAGPGWCSAWVKKA
ncbi:MAG TPA: high-potential iron-sulfur protein [Noviherbaspirillum sp.]|jgi:hypothetical protein|uniref:high-potential iron-sulfur protein n=1 Tax=Noviherbaspirillum sp. TaxID=1926288 RepID=UPI002DDD33CC|nr:high-potential iron-sulfur protein [Noviherbaspirillum sp.]HEV2612065.1 high-potential iron-sulfur protein [Noviherbaspirillum sp.]